MPKEPDMTADSDQQSANPEPENSEIDPQLLKILVCPLTKAPLTYDREANELISKKARLAFPVRDGIPIMLPSEARNLDESTK